MKKLLILVTMFIGYANAEIIELDCRFKDSNPLVLEGKEIEYQHLFTIDTKSNRMYDGMIEFILETQPHYYIAYPRYLFENNELLLTEKQIYPRSYWSYKINRENLNYWQRGHDSPTRLSNDSKCTIINRDNII